MVVGLLLIALHFLRYLPFELVDLPALITLSARVFRRLRGLVQLSKPANTPPRNYIDSDIHAASTSTTYPGSTPPPPFVASFQARDIIGGSGGESMASSGRKAGASVASEWMGTIQSPRTVCPDKVLIFKL